MKGLPSETRSASDSAKDIPNVNQSIVSSDLSKISIKGYKLLGIPTPKLREEASNYQYWAYDIAPVHYTFAVISNENGGSRGLGFLKENQVDGQWVYTISFSMDMEGTGRVYVSYYGKDKKWLGESQLINGQTITKAGYTFANSQGIIS